MSQHERMQKENQKHFMDDTISYIYIFYENQKAVTRCITA